MYRQLLIDDKTARELYIYVGNSHYVVCSCFARPKQDAVPILRSLNFMIGLLNNKDPIKKAPKLFTKVFRMEHFNQVPLSTHAKNNMYDILKWQFVHGWMDTDYVLSRYVYFWSASNLDSLYEEYEQRAERKKIEVEEGIAV